MPRINSFDRTVWKYDEWVSSQSEAVMIESRRRMDLALAILISVKPIWDKLDELENRHESQEKRKTIKYVGVFGLIAIGLILGYILSSEGNDFNIGHVLAIAGVCFWWLMAYNRRMLYRSLSELEATQSEYHFRWMESVGESNLFFSERRLHKDENKVEGIACTTPAEAEDKRKHLEERRRDNFYKRQYEILCRVSGESPNLGDSTRFY